MFPQVNKPLADKTFAALCTELYTLFDFNNGNNDVFDFVNDDADKEIDAYIKSVEDGNSPAGQLNAILAYMNQKPTNGLNAETQAALNDIKRGIESLRDAINKLYPLGGKDFQDPQDQEEYTQAVTFLDEQAGHLKDQLDKYNQATDFEYSKDPAFRLLNAFFSQAKNAGSVLDSEAKKAKMHNIETELFTGHMSDLVDSYAEIERFVYQHAGTEGDVLNTDETDRLYDEIIADQDKELANIQKESLRVKTVYAARQFEEAKTIANIKYMEDQIFALEVKLHPNKVDIEDSYASRQKTIDLEVQRSSDFIKVRQDEINAFNNENDRLSAENKELENENNTINEGNSEGLAYIEENKTQKEIDQKKFEADITAERNEAKEKIAELNNKMQAFTNDAKGLLSVKDDVLLDELKFVQLTNKEIENKIDELGTKEAGLYRIKRDFESIKNAASLDSILPADAFTDKNLESGVRSNSLDLANGIIRNLAFVRLMNKNVPFDELVKTDLHKEEKLREVSALISEVEGGNPGILPSAGVLAEKFAIEQFNAAKSLIDHIDDKVSKLQGRFSFSELMKPENQSIFIASDMLMQLNTNLQHLKFAEKITGLFKDDSYAEITKKITAIASSIGMVRVHADQLMRYAQNDFAENPVPAETVASGLLSLKILENSVEESIKKNSAAGKKMSDVLISPEADFSKKLATMNKYIAEDSFYTEKIKGLDGKMTSGEEYALNAIAKEALINPNAFTGMSVSNFESKEKKLAVPAPEPKKVSFLGKIWQGSSNIFSSVTSGTSNALKSAFKTVKSWVVNDNSFDGTISSLGFKDGNGKSKETLFGHKQKEILDLSSKLNTLKDKQKEYLKDHKSLADWNKKLEDCGKKEERHNGEQAAIDNLIEQKKNVLAQYTERIEANRKKINSNNAKIDANKQQIEERKNAIKQANDNITAQNKGTELLKMQRAADEAALKNFKENLSLLKKALSDSLEPELKKLQRLEKYYDRLEASVKKNKEAALQKKEKLQAIKTEVGALKSRYDNTLSQNANIARAAENSAGTITDDTESIRNNLRIFRNRIDLGKRWGHQDSDEFKRMKNALDAAIGTGDPLALRESLAEIRNAAHDYLFERNRDVSRKIYTSNMRLIRLAFAKELEQWAKTEISKPAKYEFSADFKYFINRSKGEQDSFEKVVGDKQHDKIASSERIKSIFTMNSNANKNEAKKIPADDKAENKSDITDEEIKTERDSSPDILKRFAYATWMSSKLRPAICKLIGLDPQEVETAVQNKIAQQKEAQQKKLNPVNPAKPVQVKIVPTKHKAKRVKLVKKNVQPVQQEIKQPVPQNMEEPKEEEHIDEVARREEKYDAEKIQPLRMNLGSLKAALEERIASNEKVDDSLKDMKDDLEAALDAVSEDGRKSEVELRLKNLKYSASSYYCKNISQRQNASKVKLAMKIINTINYLAEGKKDKALYSDDDKVQAEKLLAAKITRYALEQTAKGPDSSNKKYHAQFALMHPEKFFEKVADTVDSPEFTTFIKGKSENDINTLFMMDSKAVFNNFVSHVKGNELKFAGQRVKYQAEHQNEKHYDNAIEKQEAAGKDIADLLERLRSDIPSQMNADKTNISNAEKKMKWPKKVTKEDKIKRIKEYAKYLDSKAFITDPFTTQQRLQQVSKKHDLGLTVGRTGALSLTKGLMLAAGYDLNVICNPELLKDAKKDICEMVLAYAENNMGDHIYEIIRSSIAACAVKVNQVMQEIPSLDDDVILNPKYQNISEIMDIMHDLTQDYDKLVEKNPKYKDETIIKYNLQDKMAAGKILVIIRQYVTSADKLLSGKCLGDADFDDAFKANFAVYKAVNNIFKDIKNRPDYDKEDFVKNLCISNTEMKNSLNDMYLARFVCQNININPPKTDDSAKKFAEQLYDEKYAFDVRIEGDSAITTNLDKLQKITNPKAKNVNK